MKIVIIGSGSSGNMTYLETNNHKILIDAGLSYLRLKNTLLDNKIKLDKLDAIFITHEHDDHVHHLIRILKMTKAELYINKITYNNLNKNILKELDNYIVHFIEKDVRYDFSDISIVPIELSHDTPVCYGYLAKELNTSSSFGIITDTGYINDKYFNILSKIQVLIFESNHDVELLTQSNRPSFLIERILSLNGHLSNKECNSYLKRFISKNNKLIILGHLSKDCNTIELARKEIEKNFGKELSFELRVVGHNETLPLIDTEDYKDD